MPEVQENNGPKLIIKGLGFPTSKMKVRAGKCSYTGNTVLRAQPSARKPPCAFTLKSNTPPNINSKTHSRPSLHHSWITQHGDISQSVFFTSHSPQNSREAGGENSQFATGCCRTLQTKPQASRHFPADPCSISLLTRGLLAAQNPRPLKNTRSPRRPLFVAAAALVGGFGEWEPAPPPHHAWPGRESCSVKRST